MTEESSKNEAQVDELPLESVSLDDKPGKADVKETEVTKADEVDAKHDPQEKSREQLVKNAEDEDIGHIALPAAAEDSSTEPTTTQIENRKRPAPLQTELGKDKPSHEIPKGQNMAEYMTPPTPGLPPNFDPKYREALEKEPESRSNAFTPTYINLKDVKANTLGPREQEAADEIMMEGIKALFNNKFSAAKDIFEAHAKEDPLYSLGLGAMAFIKAITSSNPLDADAAIATLTETYQFAHAQIDAASAKKPLKDTVSHYITNLMGTNTTRLPTNTRPLNQEELKNQSEFMPNGALRAHVIKAECGLLMAIVHLTQETVVGYLKTGLNLRRAYSAYSLVWQEYKRMGQDFHKHIDQDTVSAIQFGIGSVHLLLSSLPPKILKIVSAFGWNADKHLGFALLKLCLEGKRIRSPLASMMLLSYYVILTSHAPLILDQELVQPAVECLLEAQKTYPSSAFFLYFAGRVSRLTRSISLSSQSFKYTQEVSQGEWAEVAMGLLADYEIAFNSAMQLDWKGAADRLEKLVMNHSKPALIKYFYGACMEMLGNRSDAILAFAEAPKLVRNGDLQVEQFVCERVEFFEQSGYQDLDLSLPALEILLLWNLLASMTDECLMTILDLVDATLDKIYQHEKQEYEIRTIQIAPDIPPPDYYDQRATLLLVKASILNALGRSQESIIHLNWILDNRSRIRTKWIVPFTYWESGVTCWCTQDFSRARTLWESALSFSNYPFEYRLAVRLNLVITHANELGVESALAPKPEKGRSTQGRKRMSLLSKKSAASPPESPSRSESGSSSPHV